MSVLLQWPLPVQMLILFSAAIVASTSASIGVLHPAVEWKYGSTQANFTKPLPPASSKLALIREALSANVHAIQQLLKEDPMEEFASLVPSNQKEIDVSRYPKKIAVDIHVAERDVARFNPLIAVRAGLSPPATTALRWSSQHQAFLANNMQANIGKPDGGSTNDNNAATNPPSVPKPKKRNSPDEQDCGGGDLECELSAQPHKFITIAGAVSGCFFLCCFCVCFVRNRRLDSKEVVHEDMHVLDEMHEVWVLQEWKALAPGVEAQLET